MRAKLLSRTNKCDYKSTSNLLCRIVGFTINNDEMSELNAQILTQSQILSGYNYPVRINNGRIHLNRFLFQPKPISKLTIIYFGTDYERQKKFNKKIL
ncbi:unnamed protein product [Rotaria sordida]|uniref:Uncharacterized protein n=1 Tax=Rotaria sordida TaxID=392033 RepID=A0A815HRE6_9BILA|nr:unnamed protein product [Rotaria sordida]CAF1360867.1 unnamed protein product [Rotaria sordida]CAF1604428.1 unnamed protein product [Rotaria sordida]CAF4124180.1 unnamed protein product [Rotaria sordida]CAF4188930.1 unnamed protein product [Rotaria sordida]